MAQTKAEAKSAIKGSRQISKSDQRGRGSIPQLIFGDLWEFDPAPETADPKIRDQYELYIGGKFVEPRSDKYFDSINPATEKVVSRIALANYEDVDAAYQAARKAYDHT